MVKKDLKELIATTYTNKVHFFGGSIIGTRKLSMLGLGTNPMLGDILGIFLISI